MSLRLAIGAVAAALVLGDAATPGLALAMVLAAGSIAGAGWLLVATRVRPALGRSLAAAAVGAGAVALRLLLMPPVLPTAPAVLPDGDGPWPAIVASVGSLREGARPAVLDLPGPPALRLAATLPAWPIVVPGDRIEVDGEPEPPPDDDYGDYLRRIGAAGTIRSRSLAITDAPGDAGRQLEGLRRGADAALSLAIPEPEAGLASGILLGLRDRVDRALAAAFTAVGASHVVAISGWNIAIVATMLGAIAGRVARRRRALLTAAAIVGYVVFVGASPSVVRAAAMAGVVLGARELGRPSRAAAAIGWAVIGLLLVDPRLVDDVGFRLSALATAGLIAWGTPLTSRFAGPSPGRVRAWLAESLGVSLAAQLATLPIVALEFGRLSIVSPVINLGVVPLVAPAMAGGAVALAAGGLGLIGAPAIIAVIAGLPAWVLLSGIVALVRLGAAVPFASVELVAPWDVVAALAATAVVVAVDWRLRRRSGPASREPAPPAPVVPAPGRAGPSLTTRLGLRAPAGRVERAVAIGLAGAVLALSVAVIHRPDGIARLTVLDVGQGDAILLEGERGSRLLVDGGPDPGRLLVALDEHLPPWDRRIDAIVLSHPHEDHDGGLAALIGRYGVKRILEPGMIGPGPGYTAFNAILAGGPVTRGVLMTGDRLAVDDVRLEVLWPDPGAVPETPPDTGTAINNVSIVLLGEAAGHRFLLAGDIEEEIDPTLLARGLPRVEVLKVAHHGSRTSSTQPFLDAVDPAIAVISSGRGNPYGHPAAATVARIEDLGTNLYRTDTDGTVEIELGPGPIGVRSANARSVATAPGEDDRTAPALVTAALVAAASTSGATPAFLCALPVHLPSSIDVATRPPAAAPTPLSPVAMGLLSPDRRPTLGYHAPGDPPLPGSAGRTLAIVESDGRSRGFTRRPTPHPRP